MGRRKLAPSSLPSGWRCDWAAASLAANAVAGCTAFAAPLGWGLLPGAPTPTGAGLPPAEAQRATVTLPHCTASSVMSRRTMR